MSADFGTDAAKGYDGKASGLGPDPPMGRFYGRGGVFPGDGKV